MDPIGILYCIDRLDRGGTELQLAGLIRRLDRSRFRPHLCTLRGGGDLIDSVDAETTDLGLGSLLRPGGIRGIGRLADHLKRNDIAVVQTFFQDSAVVGMLAARRAGVPVRIISLRDLGFWRTPAWEFLMRRIHPLATGFLANSGAIRDHFAGRDGLALPRFRVIPNGIDPAAVPFIDHAGDAEPAVVLVGNLNREVKRPDIFLDAAARLAADHPEATWHLVGEGRLRPGLERRVAREGLAGRVRFHGAVVDVGPLLASFAVGVNCSDSEGFANAVLEYMLAGCAVAATAVGGTTEAVRDGETGLLVPPGDGGALAAAIGRLLDDPAARSAMARRARAAATDGFGWDRCVAAHQEYYRTALAEAAAPAGRH